MKGETTIRAAGEHDLPAILDIYNHAILHTAAVYDYRPHTLAMRQQWFEQKTRSGLPVLVARQGDSVTGFASFGPFRPWAAYKYTVEHSLYVAPEHQHKGIGRALLHAIIQAAEKHGVHVMIAGIDSANKASIDMHLNTGFGHCGAIRQAAYKFGCWRDLVFMQYIFPQTIAATEDRPE